MRFKILWRSCEKHLVPASFEGFGSYLNKKWVKSAQFVVFLAVLRVFCPIFTEKTAV